MTKFLTLFDTQAAYDAAESSLDLPNVSLIAATNAVIYKPYVPTTETRVVAKFNITDTSSPTQIAYSTDNFSAIEIDGVAQPSVVSGYTFETTGEHTVKYTLTVTTTIGDYALQYCSGLTSVDIPNSVTSIGAKAFQDCESLTSVTIGNSVESIGDIAFAHCESLTSINIPDSVTSIGYFAFQYCSKLSSITIPNSVTTIGDEAFSYCSKLKSITIGNNVTSIGQYAFSDCESLTSITVLATTPPTLSGYVFESTNNCPIYVPSGSVDAYKAPSGWSDYASRIQAIP